MRSTVEKPDRIIIIDDEIDMCWVLERLLSRHGYMVNTAASGELGLELVRTCPAAVAIVDCKLPDMDGLAVASECLRIDPNIRIVLISGFPFAEESLLLQHIEQMSAHFLAKPFDNHRLVELVIELTEH